MTEYLNARSSTKPLFLSILTSNTHFPYQVASGDFKKSASPLRDSFSGMDHHFGLFWSQFKKSRYYDNSIVVVLGDHSMFPTAEYRSLQTQEGSFSPPALEKIPLIIHLPTHLMPLDKMDLSVLGTSLDLAPTLFELLGMDLANPYLGLSLVSDRKHFPHILTTHYETVAPHLSARWPIGYYNKFLMYLKRLAWKDRIVQHP